MCRYLVYIGFAAKAVNDNRRRKRQDALELDDEMDVKLMKKDFADEIMKKDVAVEFVKKDVGA